MNKIFIVYDPTNHQYQMEENVVIFMRQLKMGFFKGMRIYIGYKASKKDLLATYKFKN